MVQVTRAEGVEVPQKINLAPRVVTLGTAGGPRWWSSRTGQHRHGIATAVVVGDDYYLVDAGLGVGRQLERADLSFNNMRAMFVRSEERRVGKEGARREWPRTGKEKR